MSDVRCEKCDVVLPLDWENSAYCEPCNTEWCEESLRENYPDAYELGLRDKEKQIIELLDMITEDLKKRNLLTKAHSDTLLQVRCDIYSGGDYDEQN